MVVHLYGCAPIRSATRYEAQPIEPKQDSFDMPSSNRSQLTFRPSIALIARQRRHSARASRQNASPLNATPLHAPGNVDDTVSAAHFFTVITLSSFITRLAILPLGSATTEFGSPSRHCSSAAALMKPAFSVFFLQIR